MVPWVWRCIARGLELGAAANSEGIVAFNSRDFAGVEPFGLWIMTPREFLARIGEIG